GGALGRGAGMAGARRGRVVVLAVSTVLLALACWAAMQGMSRLSQMRAQGEWLRAEKMQLQNELPVIEQRETYARQAQEVKAMAARLGIDPERWTNRRVQRSPALTSRSAAEAFPRQQPGPRGRRWFDARRS